MSQSVPEGFYHEAVLKAPYAIAAISLDGKFLFVNHFFSVLTGYSNTELKTLSWMDITHHEDIGADLLEVNKVRSGENALYMMTKKYIKKSGDIIDVELVVHRYPPDGDVLILLAYVKDIMTADTYIKKLTHEIEDLKCKCVLFSGMINEINDPNRIFRMLKSAVIANWGVITVTFGVISTIIGWVVTMLAKGG